MKRAFISREKEQMPNFCEEQGNKDNIEGNIIKKLRGGGDKSIYFMGTREP